MDGARMVVSSDSYRDRRTFMKSIANDVLSGKCEDGMYYISRAWYVFKCLVSLMHMQMALLFYGALNYYYFVGCFHN